MRAVAERDGRAVTICRAGTGQGRQGVGRGRRFVTWPATPYMPTGSPATSASGRLRQRRSARPVTCVWCAGPGTSATWRSSAPFRLGSFADQVDASSGAFNKLARGCWPTPEQMAAYARGDDLYGPKWGDAGLGAAGLYAAARRQGRRGKAPDGAGTVPGRRRGPGCRAPATVGTERLVSAM